MSTNNEENLFSDFTCSWCGATPTVSVEEAETKTIERGLEKEINAHRKEIEVFQWWVWYFYLAGCLSWEAQWFRPGWKCLDCQENQH